MASLLDSRRKRKGAGLTGLVLSTADLRHLRTFLVIVEQGGISAAAEALDCSISQISRDLSNLEQRLGMQLCRRGRSGFSLTTQGEEVHGSAIGLFSEVARFEQTVQGARQTLAGGFNVGVIDNVVTNPESGIAAALAQMNAHFPDMLINVSVHTPMLIDLSVRDRRIDVGVTGQPAGVPGLCCEPAFTETHRLYISASSPHVALTTDVIAGRAPLDAQLPYVARDYRADAFAVLEQAYPINVVVRGRTLESVLAAVLSGVGSALLPGHFVRATGASALVELETPVTPLSVQFYFLYRRDAANMRSIHALLKRF